MSPKQKFQPTLTADFGDLDFGVIGQTVFVARENIFLMVCKRSKDFAAVCCKGRESAHKNIVETVRWQRIATRTEPAWKFSNVHMSLAPSRPCVRCQVVWTSSIEVL